MRNGAGSGTFYLLVVFTLVEVVFTLMDSSHTIHGPWPEYSPIIIRESRASKQYYRTVTMQKLWYLELTPIVPQRVIKWSRITGGARGYRSP
jgi:hypothetical protein